MRKIVDSNYLRAPELAAYLSASRKNVAVLCDYAGIEAYKSTNPIASMAAPMSILAKYPKQVIVLKNTVAIQKLKMSSVGAQRRMIDDVQTKEFAIFCKHLDQTHRGSARFAAQLLAHGEAAAKHAGESLDGAKAIRESIAGLAMDFTHDELALLRSNKPISHLLFQKIQRQALAVAAYAHIQQESMF